MNGVIVAPAPCRNVARETEHQIGIEQALLDGASPLADGSTLGHRDQSRLDPALAFRLAGQEQARQVVEGDEMLVFAAHCLRIPAPGRRLRLRLPWAVAEPASRALEPFPFR